MPVKIDPSWKEVLREEFNKEYFENLITFVKQEYETKTCYPPGNKIFAAFDRTPFEDVKVVILGQDPYHGAGQANGLCFSVADGITHPPSLINIFKEQQRDIDLRKPYPKSGNLEHWADQGVLLLNATLTVEAGKAGSHQKKGWEQFTDQVIKTLAEEREKLVFMLWGSFAKSKLKLIDEKKHFVLTSGHPSPLSANRGYWFDNKHFSRCNRYLKEQGKKPIDW
ncbi:Uracil-DNA glycosylase [Nonlabens sp. Hel1_33_55]|uniref:uracil-DNA glycosylase n=1 Tax=Nonlabens sp. Hel1_33_55 TaxID=1336802 RepID=UPI000875ACD7|nr:uracil-DNA glycosylase [Nonlabens sp. Hel1_33_55]SCY03242.1 Uracil-DNA glycosylase [Nonlabens sp. Hel1_33_55]